MLRSESVKSAIGADLESSLKKLKSDRARVQDLVDKNEAGPGNCHLSTSMCSTSCVHACTNAYTYVFEIQLL